MFGKVGPKECTSLLEVFNDVHINIILKKRFLFLPRFSGYHQK